MHILGHARAGLALSLGVLCVGCDGAAPDSSGSPAPPSTWDVPPPVGPETADSKTLVKDNTTFGLELYRGFATDETSNVVYSPYSLSLALAMTYAGASNETAEQIAAVARFAQSPAALGASFAWLDGTLASRARDKAGAPREGYRLVVADSLWGDQNLTFQPTFLSILHAGYASDVQRVDFAGAPDAARDAINSWVASETEDRIQELFAPGSITSADLFVIVNAIDFGARWSTPFAVSETAEHAFTRLDGARVQVEMMRRDQESLGAVSARGPGYQAFGLPYGNGTSMVIVLPHTGRFAAIEAGLTGTFVDGVSASLAWEEGLDLRVPKFTVHGATVSVRAALKRLGLRDAFDATRADFTGMVANSKGSLYIFDVVQQAFVAVDEAGTQAGAASAVVGGFFSLVEPSRTAFVDRPFFYFIRDDATGTVLFVGRELDPTR